jgi:hypothetical protein
MATAQDIQNWKNVINGVRADPAYHDAGGQLIPFGVGAVGGNIGYLLTQGGLSSTEVWNFLGQPPQGSQLYGILMDYVTSYKLPAPGSDAVQNPIDASDKAGLIVANPPVPTTSPPVDPNYSTADANIVRDLYNRYLGRANPADADVAFWARKLASDRAVAGDAAARANLEWAFANSTDYRDRVSQQLSDAAANAEAQAANAQAAADSANQQRADAQAHAAQLQQQIDTINAQMNGGQITSDQARVQLAQLQTQLTQKTAEAAHWQAVADANQQNADTHTTNAAAAQSYLSQVSGWVSTHKGTSVLIALGLLWAVAGGSGKHR